MNNLFDKQFDCFVISLNRTPQRRESFQKQNSHCGINFQYFDGVDGRELNLAQVEGPIVVKGSSFRTGSIGAAMSHLALWRRCAEQSKHFVVFEDDAVVRNDIKMRLPELLEHFGTFDIIILGYNTDVPLEIEIAPGVVYGGGFSEHYPTPKHLADFVGSANQVALHKLRMSIGIPGYVVSPEGAQLLVRECFPMDNRLVTFASWRVATPCRNIDLMMAALYPKIKAYACVAPLVMTPNEQRSSLTINP
jgi:GR25 family glycosyltransferase involved in LPS biosynthesis